MKTKRLFSVIAILMVFCTSLAAQDKLRAEKNVRELYNLMDAGAFDKAKDYVSDDFKIMNPFLPSPQPLQAFIQIIQGQKGGFPDVKHEITEIVSDGKTVISKGIYSGTNTGSFMGNPPTGNKVSLSFLVWDEMDNMGKIKNRTVQFDSKAFEGQLMAGKVSPETIKRNTRIAYESLSKRDFATFKTVCSKEDFIEYSAGPMPIKGVDNAIEAYKQYFSLAPDLKISVQNIIVDGNRAIVENTSTGTNTGMVMGILPASGKNILINDIDIVTFDANGLATSHRIANPNETLYQIGYGSLANPNTGIVMDIYQKFAKGDVAGIVANCSENILFDVRDNPVIKNPRLISKSSEMPNFFGELAEACDVTKFEPYRILADGDDVMTVINVEWKSKSSGKIWGSTFSHHFKMKNDKVVSFKEITIKPWEVIGMASMK